MDEEEAAQLTGEQQERLDATKIQINMENERYLQAHPELRAMVGIFVHEVLEQKPEDILRFAGDFFTRDDLHALVKTEEVRKG
mmetsp:Transcript_44384/g.117763  ORF Transcript_44384/g.117763 Transcript_44384/m.117763 type:complete len:83 (-) Transcript_44384:151-399(-)